jgi:hypothetical protein
MVELPLPTDLLQPEKKERLRWAEIALAIIFAVIPGVPSMPVVWSCLSVSFAWLLACHIAFTENRRLTHLPLGIKLGMTVIPYLLAWVMLAGWVHKLWRIEQSEKVEGELVASGPIPFNLKTKLDDNRFAIAAGPGGVFFTAYRNNPHPLVMFGDKLQFAQSEDGKLLVTTAVRDHNGNLIAQILENKWTVPKSTETSWDKNYNDNCLEVKNGRDSVVLQICLFTNGIQLQELTHDEFGKHFYELVEEPNGEPLYDWGPIERADSSVSIKEMFRYPSKYFWSQLSRR